MINGDGRVGRISNVGIEQSPLVLNNTSSKSCIIEMSSQDCDAIIAKQSVTANHHSRIVINIQGVGNCSRGTSRACLGNHCSIDEAVCIVIRQGRVVNKRAISNIFDQDTISIPSEDIGFVVNTAIGRCGNRNLCTLTNIFFANLNRGNNGKFSRIDRDLNSVSTEGSCLCYNQEVGSLVFDRISRQCQFTCTVYSSKEVVDIPLISHIINVVIINMTSEGGNTAFTNSSIINRDCGNRSSLYIDFVRFAHDGTTSTEVDLNCVYIRFILCGTRAEMLLTIVEDGRQRLQSHACRSIVHVPCLLNAIQDEVVIPADICKKGDNGTFADHLIARNNHDRQRTYRNSRSSFRE